MAVNIMRLEKPSGDRIVLLMMTMPHGVLNVTGDKEEEEEEASTSSKETSSHFVATEFGQ